LACFLAGPYESSLKKGVQNVLAWLAGLGWLAGLAGWAGWAKFVKFF